MGNTEYRKLFGKFPRKKHPHGVRRLPLPLSCFHYIVLCKHFRPFSPLARSPDRTDKQGERGGVCLRSLAGRLWLHEHAAAVMAFPPLFPSLFMSLLALVFSFSSLCSRSLCLLVACFFSLLSSIRFVLEQCPAGCSLIICYYITIYNN